MGQTKQKGKLRKRSSEIKIKTSQQSVGRSKPGHGLAKKRLSAGRRRPERFHSRDSDCRQARDSPSNVVAIIFIIILRFKRSDINVSRFASSHIVHTAPPGSTGPPPPPTPSGGKICRSTDTASGRTGNSNNNQLTPTPTPPFVFQASPSRVAGFTLILATL